jgi:hypothetical protein
MLTQTLPRDLGLAIAVVEDSLGALTDPGSSQGETWLAAFLCDELLQMQRSGALAGIKAFPPRVAALLGRG